MNENLKDNDQVPITKREILPPQILSISTITKCKKKTITLPEPLDTRVRHHLSDVLC